VADVEPAFLGIYGANTDALELSNFRLDLIGPGLTSEREPSWTRIVAWIQVTGGFAVDADSPRFVLMWKDGPAEGERFVEVAVASS